MRHVQTALLALLLCGCSGMYYSSSPEGAQRFVMRGDLGIITVHEANIRDGNMGVGVGGEVTGIDSGRVIQSAAVPSELRVGPNGLAVSGVFSSSQVTREDWEGLNMWSRIKESFWLGGKVVENSADVLTEGLEVTEVIATDE